MIKQEYKEAHDKDLEMYDRSILSHEDDRVDSMKDYEFSIMRRDDDYQDTYDEPCIGHFNDY